MLNEILERIESLPPLPETIVQIEEFRTKENQEVEELINILGKDPFVTTTLLKIGNSPFFAFRSKIESLSRLVNLLGMKFVIFTTISETVQNLLTTNLEPYCITNEQLRESSTLSTVIINLWIGRINHELKDELLLPAMLHRAGKLITSEIIIKKNLSNEFQNRIKQGELASNIEKDLLGITTSEVTSRIFKHWKLSENFVNMIQHIDDIENCNEEYLEKTRILEIVKLLTTPQKVLDENKISLALQKVSSYNLYLNELQKTIEILKERNN